MIIITREEHHTAVENSITSLERIAEKQPEEHINDIQPYLLQRMLYAERMCWLRKQDIAKFEPEIKHLQELLNMAECMILKILEINISIKKEK